MIEIGRHLEMVDRQINNAYRAISGNAEVSEQTRRAVKAFCEKTHETLSRLADMSEAQIRDSIFEIEDLADRAKAAVKADQENPEMKSQNFQQVIDAHNSISSLKREFTH